MKPTFKIVSKDKNARAGEIKTAHGKILTPAFFPVGTQGSVKSLDPKQLKEIGVQGLLGNTYHLHLRPGETAIAKFGGLAKWMNWNGPTMTDSGGFQVFSLGIGLEKPVRVRSDVVENLLSVKPETSHHQRVHKPVKKLSSTGIIQDLDKFIIEWDIPELRAEIDRKVAETKQRLGL